jgi:energy-coupling factor transporter ATP-binding protein EcfA2
MIDDFHVCNYKALRDVSLKLTPMHALIGPNDSGKTSILEAVAALCRSVDHDLANAFVGSWEGRALVWRGGSEPVLVEAGLETGLRYSLSCQFAPSGRTVAVGHESTTVGGEVHDIRSQGMRLTAVCEVVDRGSAPEHFLPAQQALADLFKRVSEGLIGVQMCRWNPRWLALPAAADAQRSFFVEASGFGLPLCLDNILGYDRKRFTELEDRFIAIFPEFKSIKLLPEKGYRAVTDDPTQIPAIQQADGKGVFFEFAGNGHVVSAAQASDGVLLVLAYLTILYIPQPARVLLIEEPENGVHPKRLQEVLQILRRLIEESGHTQVLLTTHSPYALDFFEPQEVTLCRKEGDGSVVVRRLSDIPTVREQLKVFTLGEIWTAEGDEKLGSSAEAAEGAAP